MVLHSLNPDEWFITKHANALGFVDFLHYFVCARVSACAHVPMAHPLDFDLYLLIPCVVMEQFFLFCF